MADTRPPAAPRALGPAGRALWRDIAKQMASDGLVPDAREQRFLLLACAEQDQLAKLEAELADLPLTVKGAAGQPVAQPLLAEARRSRVFIAAQLARLDFFDSTAGKGSGRGSRTTSTQARDAAMTRHRSGY